MCVCMLVVARTFLFFLLHLVVSSKSLLYRPIVIVCRSHSNDQNHHIISNSTHNTPISSRQLDNMKNHIFRLNFSAALDLAPIPAAHHYQVKPAILHCHHHCHPGPPHWTFIFGTNRIRFVGHIYRARLMIIIISDGPVAVQNLTVLTHAFVSVNYIIVIIIVIVITVPRWKRRHDDDLRKKAGSKRMK